MQTHPDFRSFPTSGLNKKHMSFPSLIFWLIFVIPLVVFLIWVMRQDKRRGVAGLLILLTIVAVGVIYMYLKTGGQ
ncbi:hypothetical protein LT679_17990 [Mucilaginibacter roseus]|uniref:Cardiolipin synthase N-terminal domain-containing protein n=1 Tax=Mucilaginibacter roseus TaxID=1528868 RepID=A0ABS8U761_9SPHI|nr:hypothetical protein [Mucilaginibacter roseus]MCD8742507.1 hypothetical protein [Mucilaginibacter roseus]